jgi:hypothetical protein
MGNQPLAWFKIVGRDDEKALATCESGFKRRRIVEIALARLDALCLQIGHLFWIARHRNNRTGAGLDQQFDDLPTELAGSAGNDKGSVLNIAHGLSPMK